MEYLDYLVEKLYDGLEDFFKSFSIVSGRATFKVALFTLIHLFLAVLSELLDKFTFVDIWSALLANFIIFIIISISVVQNKDIDKFKRLLKGDDNYD